MSTRIAIGAGAVLALATAVVEFAHSHSFLYASGALVAGALAAAVVWFVTTLPGLTVRGLVIGGFFVLAGMVSWTYMDDGKVVWAVLAAEGIVFAWWSWPWLRDLPVLPRLAGSWLGLAYWVLGVVGALLVGSVTVGAQRVAYAGVFGLAVLAVIAGVRRDGGRDLSVGIVGSFLLAIAALLVSGSGNLFQHRHVIPNNGWGREAMVHRFWGGHWLMYHPNSLALIAVIIATRIGVDRAFAVWQRLAVTLLAGWVVFITNSRTGFVYFAAAALVHAYVIWRRRGADVPSYRRVWVAMATPLVVAALVGGISEVSGQGFLFKQRYNAGDPTSGRTDSWKQVGREWVGGNLIQKTFGDTKTSRAVVVRNNMKLTTDNAAVGALRHGGVLGELAFLLGLGLLLWRSWRGYGSAAARRAPPAWLTVTAVGAVPTIATADWLLGGTGGTLWILLVAGEAWLVLRPSGLPGESPAPIQSGQVPASLG